MFSSTAYADSRIVSIYVDGEKKVFSTEATTVGEVLKRENIQLQDGDLVEPGLASAISRPYFNINLYRARPLLVVDGGREYKTTAASENPKVAAQRAGLTVYPEDRYSTEIVRDFVDDQVVGLKISIQRATPVVVTVDGKTTTLRTQRDTIAELLAEKKIVLGEKDKVTPQLSTALVAGLSVQVTRVAEITKTEEVKIPRQTQSTADPNLLKGTTQVKEPGEDGVKTVTYRIYYENGAEIRRETLSSVLKSEAKPRVVVVGTKVLFRGSVEYWRPFVTEAATARGLDPNRMLRIMQCESSGNAQARNGVYSGLFQYHPTTWSNAIKRFGTGSESIWDGEAQIRITAAKMSVDGFGEWECR